MKRILYSGSVHDQDEKDAVMAVLDGGVTSFMIGKNVAEMERQVAALFGKASGVMVNSGSSALYLAVELLGGMAFIGLAPNGLDRLHPASPILKKNY